MNTGVRLATALRLAKEATNGWACFARRETEHREIARLHQAIDVVRSLEAQPSQTIPDWQPWATIPRDRWVWVFSPSKHRNSRVTTLKWDAEMSMWQSGLGWYPVEPGHFSHWAEMAGQPPQPPVFTEG